MASILVIDNYDSFTYNIVQYLETLGASCRVVYNDALTIEQVVAVDVDAILLSPGPCTPNEAGICLKVIEKVKRPILGVCLGHQSIGQAFGATIVRAKNLMHGKTSDIFHDGRSIFQNLENPFVATRYHSLLVDPATVPDCLEVSAWSSQKEIMGLRHKTFPIEGVQFHPESILTQSGLTLFKNWLSQNCP